jgi:hypothetical protein
MNTDHLAKLYDALTARERLPLIIAAAARDDEAEQKRLSVSAPKETLQVPEHFRLARALAEVVHYHLLTVLDLAANFWQWWGLWMAHNLPGQAEAKRAKGKREKAQAQAEAFRRCCMVRYLAYRFTVHVDGWKRFCTGMAIEPEVPLDFMIGWDTIVRTEKRARDLAFTPEHAALFLLSETVAAEGLEANEVERPHVETAEGLAEAWQAILDKLVQRW